VDGPRLKCGKPVTYFIGTSGWHYPHWRARYYPEDLPPAHWLEHYARDFGTVEINASFYRTPSVHVVRHWVESTPPRFVFALKASRFVTHLRKLNAPRTSTRALFRVARALGRKCGPVLFQLPPRWRCNLKRLDRFLRALPPGRDYVFEFRDPSWHRPDVYALLRRYRAAFCIYQLAGFESPHVLTADFTYIRLHGPSSVAYGGSYSDAVLAAWAREIRSWKRLKRVYLYFDNDEAAHAIGNARTLQSMLTPHAHD